MNFKQHLKTGIKLVIDADGNLYTLAFRLSKRQLLKVLDVVLPDDDNN